MSGSAWQNQLYSYWCLFFKWLWYFWCIVKNYIIKRFHLYSTTLCNQQSQLSCRQCQSSAHTSWALSHLWCQGHQCLHLGPDFQTLVKIWIFLGKLVWIRSVFCSKVWNCSKVRIFHEMKGKRHKMVFDVALYNLFDQLWF